MKNKTTIEIAHSKSKLFKILISSLFFLIMSLWILVYQPEFRNAIYNDVIVKNTIGGLAFLIGLFGMFFTIKKILDKKPGFTLDEIGIIDNSNAISIGRIRWEDIEEIKNQIVVNQKLIIIVLKNPHDYIKKETNPFKRSMVKMNFKHYSSPVNITAKGLKIDSDELKNILIKKLQEFQEHKI